MDFKTFMEIIEIAAIIIILLWRYSKKKAEEQEMRNLLSRRVISPSERAQKVGIVYQALGNDPKYKEMDDAQRTAEANNIANEHLWADWWFDEVKRSNEKGEEAWLLK